MFEQLIEKIAVELDRAGIPYMVTGGQAVLLHGEPRLTRDIDITLGADTGSLREILAVATASGLEVLEDSQRNSRETLLLSCADKETRTRVDLHFTKSSYEREAIERAIHVAFGNSQVRFATAEDLVVHKIVAGRTRGLDDVRAILHKQPRLDRHFVRTTLGSLEATHKEPFVARFERICHKV